MLPAWVNEPTPGERYARHEGEEQRERRGRDRRERSSKRPTPNFQRPISKAEAGDTRRDRRARLPRHRKERHPFRSHPSGASAARTSDHRPVERPLPPITVKFLPRSAAFDNVVAQIKSNTVAYSLFALTRLFLEKPTRYELKLTAPAEISLFQLGGSGAVSADRDFLERSAFRLSKSHFYKIDITETEPIKGNFTNVARCRLSGTVLGPTNHHDYQRRLRNLYEQRFSRRMSFAEYQHKIEIISDPAVVEKWKEEARKQTTFTTLREEPPQTFSSETEAERHFRHHYLEGLIQTVAEVTISTAQIADRVLRHVVEEAWTRETKSPSAMMQELATRFREHGLYIFRHRRGMLFVSRIYPRPFTNEQTAVSSQVRTIVDAIAASPRIGRRELADKLIVDLAEEEAERAKLALASDLLWLISAGHVMEFNDGSLDLPRAKSKPKEKATPEAETKEKAVLADSPADEKETVLVGVAPVNESTETPKETKDVVAATSPAAEVGSTESRPTEDAQIGGS